MINKIDLNKFMRKLNKLIGEEYYKSTDEFTLSDLEFIEDYMYLYNDFNKVVECFYYTYF